MELDRTILPTATSDLTFHYLRRFSHTLNTIDPEVSTNDGLTWTSVWTANGVCSGGCSSGDWDASFIPVTVPLTAHADAPIRVRFVFTPNGTIFTGTSSSYGVFIDEISESNAGTLGSEASTVVGPGSTEVDFTPAGADTYLLDLQANLACHDSSHGPVLFVTAMPEPQLVAGLVAGIATLVALRPCRRVRQSARPAPS